MYKTLMKGEFCWDDHDATNDSSKTNDNKDKTKTTNYMVILTIIVW